AGCAARTLDQVRVSVLVDVLSGGGLGQPLLHETAATVTYTLSLHDALPISRKEWTRQLFRTGVKVLVSTESGGEGLNFQFCRSVVNFDLPWNPMRLEQRIGRVHRLGQTRDVHIYNMATKDTIEEHIVALLHDKLNLFRAVVGDVEAVWT